MNSVFVQKIEKYTWILYPLSTAVLLMLTLPPINFWPLGFVAFAPVYFFVHRYANSTWQRMVWGGFLLGSLPAANLLFLTVLQFGWIKEVYIFTMGIKILSLPMIAIFGALGACTVLFARKLISKSPLLNILTFASTWTILEWFVKKLMFNLEYSNLAYPAKDTIFLSLASIGGIPLTSFAVALINASIGSLILYLVAFRNNEASRKNIYRGIFISCAVAAFTVGSVLLVHIFYSKNTTLDASKNLRIAIIQNQERGAKAFGQQIGSEFKFPDLEQQVAEANAFAPDIIIYPFAPWVGALGNKSDNSIFDRQVIAVDFSAFGKWQNDNVKKDVVFVTWNTTYRNGKFYNEINFWKNGKINGVYQKNDLFPFMDYTPALAQSLGLYTTPYDATPGITTTPVTINAIKIGGLVCSEVDKSITKNRLSDTNLLLAIGSEAIFPNGVAGELNLANAQSRAAESGRLVIRANRFGPSAFIDTNGEILSSLPYGATGVLFKQIELSSTARETIYSNGGGNIFMFGVFGFILTLLFLRKSSSTFVNKK